MLFPLVEHQRKYPLQEQRKIPLSSLQIRVYVNNICSNLEINGMINRQLGPTCGHKTLVELPEPKK